LYNAPDVLAHFVAILRADLELAASYRHVPGPALDLPITALAGDEDATVTSTQLERWASHTTGALRRHDLRGGHFYFEGQERRVCEIVLDELLGGRVVCEEVRVAAGCAV
jgi:surfactin synthase thioesterase subunit